MNFHVVGSSFSVGIAESPALVLWCSSPSWRRPCPSSRSRTTSLVLAFVPALFAHVRTLFVSHVRLRSRSRRGGIVRGRFLRALLQSATLRFRAVRVSAYRSIFRGIQGRDSVFVIASATRLVRGSSRASPFEAGPLPRFVESHFSRKHIEPNSLVIVNSVSGRNLSTCFVVGSFHIPLQS